MKKVIGMLTVLVLLASCGNNDAEIAQQRSVDSMALILSQQEAEMTHQREIDSLNAIVAAKDADSKARSNSGSKTYHTTQYVQGNAAKENPTAKRKGIGTVATGALIGAGVGAVSGAMIDKKKGRGAVIGGVAGAGIGAGTGAVIESTKKK